MDMQPFFSIITPVYNAQKYLKKCVESVIGQTFESWELILVDDGSTDDSGAICDSFCSDARIKVIHQKNAGELISRTNGIDIAQGKYELGLDADDYLNKRCLETIKKAIDVSGSDLIFFGFRYVGCQRGIYQCMLKPGKKYPQRVILEEVIENTNHSLCNKAIRLDKVKQAARFRLKKNLSINLDYAQIIPILCMIDTGYVIDDILYNYRVRGDSLSHLCKVQNIFDIGFSTEYIICKLKDANLLDMIIYDKINLAYLKMIGSRLLELFSNQKITKEDCKKIHKSKVYINSRKAESLKRLGKKNFLVLKMFRYRLYWGIKLFLK